MSAFTERYGPWALVTGASSGIGREFARELYRQGLNVAISGRSEPALERLEQDLRQTLGPVPLKTPQIRTIALDLGQTGAPAELLDRVRDLDIGLAAWSAGYGSGGEFQAADVESEAAMVDVNCRAVVELTHRVLERLTPRGQGGLILFSSLVAFQGVPFAATYSATKAFVQSFGEALAVELAPRGIDVLVAAPGPVHTGFGARAKMTMKQADDAGVVAAQIVRAIGRQRGITPGRVGKVLSAALATAPRPLRVRIMSQVMRSMTS